MESIKATRFAPLLRTLKSPGQGVLGVLLDQAAGFRKTQSKTRGPLFKNAAEQLGLVDDTDIPGELHVGKNPLDIDDKERLLTFGGNKLGPRFRRGKQEPAYRIEFREETDLGPMLGTLLARAMQMQPVNPTSSESPLESLGFPVESPDSSTSKGEGGRRARARWHHGARSSSLKAPEAHPLAPER